MVEDQLLNPGHTRRTRTRLSGLSKGQAYLNGHALGRYFVSNAKGKAVDPALPLPIPFAWLNEEGENELLIFDEHGFAPSKVKINVSRR